MSKDPIDQASHLREKMNQEANKEDSSQEKMAALPPRSSVHKVKGKEKEKEKKKKESSKQKALLVQCLAILFILLPVAILGYTYHQSKEKTAVADIPLSKTTSDYKEEISIDKKKYDDRDYDYSLNENSELDGERDLEPVLDSNLELEPNEEIKEEDTVKEVEKQQPRIIEHKVMENETLYSISQFYYQSRDGEQQIIEMNDLTSNKVTAGQILKIPLK